MRKDLSRLWSDESGKPELTEDAKKQQLNEKTQRREKCQQFSLWLKV
jgi:hypothetical protein